MYLIKCLPLSKGLNKDALSYFGSEYLEPGSLLKVNLRGKNVSALVIENQPVSEVKAEIKTASFQLKKISPPTGGFSPKPFLQKEFMRAISATSHYYATYPGNILTHLIPAIVLENPQMISGFQNQNYLINNKTKENNNGIFILQSPDEERFIHYRSLIREEFARGKSLFLCLSQNEDVRKTKEKLEKGIEAFVCGIHNNMTKSELKSELKKIAGATHPLVIISTAKWLFLPRNDIGTFIIDQENKSGWKTLARPFFDLRIFLEKLASEQKTRLIIGDSLLRIETLFRYKQGEISEFENVKWRLPIEPQTTIIDLKKSTKEMLPGNKQEKDFKIISPQVREMIREIKIKNSHTFIFAARKGIASTIVCQDCGEPVKCLNCDSPVVLYHTKIKNKNNDKIGGAFKCHQCGETRDAAEVCKNCHSWRLVALGAGIDRVADEIKKDFPEIELFEIHKDIIKTENEARTIAKKFFESKGSLLLGTEMAFSYLFKKVYASAIVSFDSLFSIPDFRIREKILELILQTKDITKEKVLIQTRNAKDFIIESITSGNLAEFYRQEIEDRKPLEYPPFSIFIKITVRGNKNFVNKETETLEKILKEYKPTIFSSVHEKKGEQSAINIVLKINKEKWPDDFIIERLKSLPPYFEIKIDPDTIL